GSDVDRTARGHKFVELDRRGNTQRSRARLHIGRCRERRDAPYLDHLLELDPVTVDLGPLFPAWNNAADAPPPTAARLLLGSVLAGVTGFSPRSAPGRESGIRGADRATQGRRSGIGAFSGESWGSLFQRIVDREALEFLLHVRRPRSVFDPSRRDRLREDV